MEPVAGASGGFNWGIATAVALLLIGGLTVVRLAESNHARSTDTPEPSTHPSAVALASQVTDFEVAVDAFQNFDTATVRDGSKYWRWIPPAKESTCDHETEFVCLEPTGSWVVPLGGPKPPLYVENQALGESRQRLETIIKESRWPTSAHDGIPSRFTVLQYQDAVDALGAAAGTIVMQAVGSYAGGYPDHSDSASSIRQRIARSLPTLSPYVSAWREAQSDLATELHMVP